jgi:hypothetical protein
MREEENTYGLLYGSISLFVWRDGRDLKIRQSG